MFLCHACSWCINYILFPVKNNFLIVDNKNTGAYSNSQCELWSDDFFKKFPDTDSLASNDANSAIFLHLASVSTSKQSIFSLVVAL